MLGKQNIYLIGPMGSGKSAVGRQLARKLELDFFDSDVEIESRTGVDIPYIFEKEGEAGFRVRESQMIAEFSKLDKVVVATGGGAVLDPGNRAKLAASGIVVFLRASIDAQLKRTGKMNTRPLLMTDNPRKILEELMLTRKPLYEEIADISIETTGRRVDTVAKDIEKLVREHPSVPLQK